MNQNDFSKKIKNQKPNIQMFAFESANKAISTFEPNCRMIGLTRGQFSLIDLINAILDKTGAADVICCTWSAGIKDAKQMNAFRNNGKIRSFKIVTDHSYATRQRNYAISLTEMFGSENIATTEIHAKFTLISNDDFNIVLTTSMNLNANKTCENYEINDDVEIYAFYKSFLDGVIKEMPKGFASSSAIVNNALNKVFKHNSPVNTEIDYIF